MQYSEVESHIVIWCVLYRFINLYRYFVNVLKINQTYGAVIPIVLKIETCLSKYLHYRWPLLICRTIPLPQTIILLKRCEIQKQFNVKDQPTHF